MEDDAYRDYCKAENSDDDEANHYLQSQLYAKIYYTLNDIESMDVKPNIESETSITNNKEFSDKINNSRTFSDNVQKEEVEGNYENIYKTSDPVLAVKDNKSNIKSICNENQIETSVKDGKKNLNVSHTLQHIQENVAISQSNKGSTNQKIEIINHPNPSNITGDVCIKPEVKETSEVELMIGNLDSEINESTIQSHSKYRNSQVDSKGVDTQEELSIVRQDVNYNNILKRYEFSKLFINKLYQEKYENLQKELQKWEEEKEKEQTEQIKETDEEIQQLYTHMNYINNIETHSKYDISNKNKKQWKTSNYSEDEIMLLSSDTETDSEKSILEVPIPPKPRPPVINLQDSDDSIMLSENNDTNECSFIIEKKTNKKVSQASIKKTNSSNNKLMNNITENIITNCSKIQKGASSIKQIMEMSKSIQNKVEKCHNKNKNDLEKNKSASTSKICNENLNVSITELHVPVEPSSNSNVVFERDKNTSVTSTEDVTGIENSNQPNLSRKRHREDDNEYSVNAKQKKHLYSRDTLSEVSTGQYRDKDKTETVWEDYFFRPLSEKVKASYNESRGQENFDIRELQSKMSKDPKLWAILDEDMRKIKKRFWDVTCTNCRSEGHRIYECSLPIKSRSCYMCGTQGHRLCPQKMCLTCGKHQGTFKRTCEFCRTLYCDMCNAIGHKSTECPDHWRRFHQTTQSSKIRIPENLSEVMKPADLLYCCNCTKRGHDASTCHDYHWSQHFPTPAFVTNYAGGPQYETKRSTASEDMIPFSKRKNKGTKNITIRGGLGHLPNCSILYMYGSFQTSRKNGQELHRELEGKLYFEKDNFLKNDFPPSFLNELTKIVSFDILIYRTDYKALFVRVRSLTDIAVEIYNLFIYWLHLNNEDKRMLNVYINIPRDEKKILNIFNTKLKEMLQTSDDPHILTKKIKSLKSSLTGISDISILYTTNDRILNLRSKLLNLYNNIVRNWPQMLQDITNKVKKCKSKNRCFSNYLYVRCIRIYNEIHLPRTLTSKETYRVFKKYPKFKNNNKNLKEKKTKPNPYEKFLRDLKQNNSEKAQKKGENLNPKSSSTTSSNIIQEQNKKVPTCPSTETITQEQNKKVPTCPSTETITQEQNKKLPTCTTNENIVQEQIRKTSCTSSNNVIQEPNNKIPIISSNVECSDNVTRTNVGDPTEICYIGEYGNSVFENSTIYPKEAVQVPHNNDASINDKVENTINHVQEKIPKPNAPIMPVLTTISHQPGNKKIKRTFYTLVQGNKTDSEENMETVKNNNAPATSSSQQQDLIQDQSETFVSKKKKKKVKKTSESGTGIVIDEVTSTDVSIESKAQKIINEALKFNLPYMNTAIEEVKKRINDKNIKQEHIDVLQRLINLEKDHQQYVSSFCSYLK